MHKMPAMKTYPFILEPVYKEKIWGGQKLREHFGKDIPPFKRIGESWELADLPNDKCTIANGEFAGKTLHEVVNSYPVEITGNKDFTGAFPLLVKFLDAEDYLSVQVHPDAEACKRMGAGEPKTECWYIVATREGAVIYKNLKKGVTREDFARAIREGTAEKMLEAVEVKPGQCHFLPAGTVHSIGAGILICEVQTPSDTTYRVYDWNRLDENGRERDLHIEQAMECIHFDQAGKELPVSNVGRLINSEYFTVDKGHQAANCQFFLKAGHLRVLIMISGSGCIKSSRDEITEFKKGQTLLIPAAFEGAIEFAEETEYLKVRPNI